MMKKLRIVWLFAAACAFAACSDSGIDVPIDEEEGNNTTTQPSEYIEFGKDTYQLSATATTFSFRLKTTVNISDLELKPVVKSSTSFTGLIFVALSYTFKSSSSGRAATNTYDLKVQTNANTGEHSRLMQFVACNKYKPEVADTILVVQDGTALRTSTSRQGDGDVEQLWHHSEGNGIPIVIMGDGFGDQEVSSGTYRSTMVKAVDYLFSEQPLTALKNYFDIYIVTVVSNQNDVGQFYDSALGTKFAGDGTANISGDEEKVKSYARKAVAKPNHELDIVIMNNNCYGGTTHMGYSNASTLTTWAVCYCPIIGDLNHEYFRTVLTHEAMGHGFANLADEYSYEENGMIPDSQGATIKQWQSYGYYQNISLELENLPWTDFTLDNDYVGEPEQIWAYEGAWGYSYGIYRPSYESMMNSNLTPFNAPSRKLIYDQVMLLSGGTTSTYEEFKQFDQANYPDFSSDKTSANASRTTLWGTLPRLPHPVITVAE